LVSAGDSLEARAELILRFADSWVLFFALFPLAAAALKSKPEEKKHKEVEHF